MAKHILLLRDGYKLTPADPQSFELIEGLKEGKVYSVEIKQSRSNGSLRLYWAGLALLVHNFSDEHAKMWPTSRHIHEACLEALGYTYKQWRVDKTFRVVVDSIALDKMPDDEFDAMFEKVRVIILGLFGYDPFDTWVAEKEAEQANKRDWRRNYRPGDSD